MLSLLQATLNLYRSFFTSSALSEPCLSEPTPDSISAYIFEHPLIPCILLFVIPCFWIEFYVGFLRYTRTLL